ncbi:hypothetical protein D3C83_246320 [compost metagenome]
MNENQGAESTLAMLLALAEMMLLEANLTAFQKPAETPRKAPLVAPAASCPP